MQSVSSRIWTRVAVSNSYDDNDYTTGTSDFHMIDNCSIAVHAFPMGVLTSLSVEEILLLRYVNWLILDSSLRELICQLGIKFGQFIENELEAV